MARTTLNLDDTVLRELKARSAAERRPLGDVASDLLAAGLKQAPQAPSAVAFAWTSAKLGQPLVDLDDKDAVWAALDGRS